MARRSKTVVPSSKRDWKLNSDEFPVAPNLTLQFRSHTLDAGGFKKEKSFYSSTRINDNYRKPIRFLNFNRPKTAKLVGEAFSTINPRRGLQSPISSYSSQQPAPRNEPYTATRVFLTQEARSREVTTLSSSHLGASVDEDVEEDEDLDENERPKPELAEIQKMLYKRECTKLGITPVGKFLRNAPGTDLSIRYYNLGSEGAKALAVPLILDATVTTLDLEGNDIGPDGLASMAEMMGEHCAIQSVNLRRNSLGSRGATIICKVLLKSKTITSLNVAANNFVDKDGIILANMLKDNRQLRSLDLSDNGLGECSGKALGEALTHNEVLEELDLKWNRFSGKGAAKLLVGLKENVGLKTLNLSFNSISLGVSKSTGTPLGDAISGNATLVSLDVSGCHLLDLDMLCVAKGLKGNDTLETLRIGHNLVQVQSVSVLIKAVAKNESSEIKLLDFGDSAVEECALEDVETLRSREVKIIHGMVHQSETDFEAGSCSNPNRRQSRTESVNEGSVTGSATENATVEETTTETIKSNEV